MPSIHLPFFEGRQGYSAFRGIVRFFEEPLLEQLYWYTHENINALSAQKMF